MRKVAKFIRYPLADKLLLVKTTLWIAGVWAALNLFRFQMVQAFLVRMGKPARERPPDTDVPNVQRIIWAVNVSSHYLLRERPCLTRALVARMLLARVGYQTTLRIGVAHSPSRVLEAHAWLERNGEIVVGNLHDLGRFTPLPPVEITRRKLKTS
ncbi:MAG: lasso peptide biosynthesis B2 protein [Anaerolineae bacterium]|nr:lasso peptide biosynthesis B2 protein [Anaerolineae bacterium]